MPNKYIIDTNVFIQSKDREYRFDFCGGFWDWLAAGHADKRLFTCKKVQEELHDGDPKKTCLARAWVDRMPTTFFLEDVADGNVMTHYGALMAWATKQPQYKPAALREFAESDNADAFLVAVARQYGLWLVTHEVPSDGARSRIPIQSAADHLGVKWIRLYDLLSIHAKLTFTYHCPP